MDVVHELDLELAERAVELSPTCAGMLGNSQVACDLSNAPQILSVILVLLHHHLDGHVGSATAARNDEGEEDLLLLGQVTLHSRPHLGQQISKAHRAVRFIRMGTLDLCRKLNQSR